jgi:hypothetical protein
MMGRLYSDHVQGTGYTVVKMDAGGKQSEVFDIGAAKNFAIQMPTVWATAGIYLRSTIDGTNYFPVEKTDGTEIALGAEASKIIGLEAIADTIAPLRKFKLCSGTAASEVAQPGPLAAAILTPAATKTLTFASGVGGLDSNAISVSMSTAGDDVLAVTVSGNTINVAVAKTTGSNNTAAAIQTAIRNIAGGTVARVDITGFTVTANAAYTSAPVTAATVAATALSGGDDTYFYIAFKE